MYQNKTNLGNDEKPQRRHKRMFVVAKDEPIAVCYTDDDAVTLAALVGDATVTEVPIMTVQ